MPRGGSSARPNGPALLQRFLLVVRALVLAAALRTFEAGDESRDDDVTHELRRTICDEGTRLRRRVLDDRDQAVLRDVQPDATAAVMSDALLSDELLFFFFGALSSSLSSDDDRLLNAFFAA